MANEILTATDSFEFATTMLGRPRSEAAGQNQLKEQSGISLGDGLVLTDSRFLTARGCAREPVRMVQPSNQTTLIGMTCLTWLEQQERVRPHG